MTISRFSILFRDYGAIVLFGITIATIVLGPLILLTWPLGFFLTFKRVGKIRNVFVIGQVVESVLTQKRRTRGEWILRYQYSYDGGFYEAVNIVVGWNLYGIKVGDRLEAVVNPKDPKQAYLVKLYSRS